MKLHPTRTTRYSPAKTHRMRGRRVIHRAQMPNAAKATASAIRNPGQGRVEK